MTATKYSAVILGITWQQERYSLPSMICVFICSDLLYQILISIIAYMRHQNFWDVKWVMASFGFSSGRPPSRVFCWSVRNTRGFSSVSQFKALQAINSLRAGWRSPSAPHWLPIQAALQRSLTTTQVAAFAMWVEECWHSSLMFPALHLDS